MSQKAEPAYYMTIEEDEEKSGEGEWYSDIICGEKLYRRLYDGIHLLCVTAKEAQQIIEEVHESSYKPHMNAHMLSRKKMR